METERVRGDFGSFTLEAGLSFHKIIDYDRKAMRRALVKGGAAVRKEARRLLSRRAISAPGEVPGLQTGALRRAVGVVSKGSKGGWVKVGIRSIPGQFFYPAPLYYGSKKAGIEPRANYMIKALEAKRETVRSDIRAALKDSLVPR